MRPGWRALTSAAAEVRWVVLLTALDTAARMERVRPHPWTDGKLLTALTVTAIGALSVAVLLGISLAEWWADTSRDLLPAAGGALVVGAALLTLLFLVFASTGPNRPEEH
ncbi:hypothetical protein HNR23_001366 [Nocardiopsis mwathae]|uniref:Uncharacterized protein n=1 Tax=Nocardiopsis mwathae TaxID=1472723 RepID=A0A7X0D526_9ACTN|nr:hypothetical protein [Nocardiopsis mwathae]MBB6171306.1 hypothetical protein [Nocardiopsis mwathae]